MSIYTLPKSKNTCKEYSTILIDIETGTGEILSDKRKNGKERPWKMHKVNNLKLHELYKKALVLDNNLISESRMKSLEECGDNLLFSVNDKNEKRLKGASFCRIRTCPMCNWRKSLKLFGQTSEIANIIINQDSSTRFLFVTFTVKNCDADKLSQTIDMMNMGFKSLTNKSKGVKITEKFKNNMLGYIRAMEVTYNQEKDTYHPHIHCIFAVKAGYFKGNGYIKKTDWQYIWGECCKTDYEPIVNVQTIKNSTAKAVAEVAKYPVKIDDLVNYDNEKKAIQALIVFTKILKGRRLITFGGVFADIKKQLKLDDVETGDLVNLEDEKENFQEVKKVLFKFNVKVGCYIC